jgi:hypothetical protein
MKKIVTLLMFILLDNTLMNAQEKFHFTINSKQDTIIVYDAHDNVILLYGKDIFVYLQTPIKMTKNKKEIIFSSPDKELGRIASKKYKKIYLEGGSIYVLTSDKKKLSYKKNGYVCASSEYSYSNSYPYFAGNKIDIEMSVDTDLNFIPFLFQSVLAHIQGTREAEEILWITSILSLCQ